MFLSLALALCISATPLPKKCTVINTQQNIVTVNINGDAYAFKGNGFYTAGEHITVIMTNNEIKGVLQ